MRNENEKLKEKIMKLSKLLQELTQESTITQQKKTLAGLGKGASEGIKKESPNERRKPKPRRRRVS